MTTLDKAPVDLWLRQAKMWGRVAVLVCTESDGNTFVSMLRAGDTVEKARRRLTASGAVVQYVLEVK